MSTRVVLEPAAAPRERSRPEEERDERDFWRGLARGAGGSLLFSLPTLMTMEMWWLGFYDTDAKLAVFGFLMLPVFILLANFSGLRDTRTWLQNVIDGFSAYGIGVVTSAVILFLFGVVAFPMPLHHAVGKLLILAAPAGFGSILANSQLNGGAGGGGGSAEDRKKQRHSEAARARAGYRGQLFLMVAGAIYLALTVAPTQEMILIPYKMKPALGFLLAALSIGVIHVFVYSLRFKGTARVSAGTPWWSLLLRFTMPGYALSVLTSAYLLWTFGRFDGADLYWIAMYSVVLGFPASVGAAAARLVL